MRTGKWIGAVWSLPLLTFAQEISGTRPAEPAPTATQPQWSADIGDLDSTAVRDVLRRVAAESISAQEPVADEPGAQRFADELAALRVGAPKRVHHLECAAFDCVAYSADGTSLYTVPRERLEAASVLSEADARDAWLSCQDTNDLLSTFERFDHCRGLTIGLPPREMRDVEIRFPGLALVAR